MPRATCDVRRALVASGVSRKLPAVAALCVAAALIAGCSDSPSGPDPVPPPPPVQTPNTPPVIDSVTVSEPRIEADQEITVNATVRDAETAVEQLIFAWSADAGSFSGTGPSVKWRAPKEAQTPANYTLRLTVTENYGAQTSTGAQFQHIVNGTSPQVRVHDSPKEIGDMALRFLRYFADSSVSADTALQEFSSSCAGTQAERNDIQDNRRKFEILSSKLNPILARVKSPWARGEATVRCEFTSRRKVCDPTDPPGCRVGAVESVTGNCNLNTVYEQQRWLLCDSTFDGALLASMRGFFGRER